MKLWCSLYPWKLMPFNINQTTVYELSTNMRVIKCSWSMKHIGFITQVERGQAEESPLGTRNLNTVLFKFAVDIVNYSSLSSPLSLQSKYQLHIYRFSFYYILFKLLLKCKYKCIQNYIIILCIIQQVERGYAGESSLGTRKLN